MHGNRNVVTVCRAACPASAPRAAGMAKGGQQSVDQVAGAEVAARHRRRTTAAVTTPDARRCSAAAADAAGQADLRPAGDMQRYGDRGRRDKPDARSCRQQWGRPRSRVLREQALTGRTR